MIISHMLKKMHDQSSRHEYLNSEWWPFLPLYIYIGFAVLTVIVMAFSGATAAAFLIYIVLASLMGLLIWWLSDMSLAGQPTLGWAWFFLLLPVISAYVISLITAGVASGNISSAAGIKMFEKRGML